MSKQKEQLFQFQRWQAGSFDKKTKPAEPPHPPESPVAPSIPTPEAPPQLKLPTVDEIERMHEDARRSGYKEGLAEGKLAGEQAMREATERQVQRFGNLISNLESALLEIEQSVAEQLLTVGIEIASQVTRGTIAANTELLLPVIREAIAALPLHHAHLTFRMNPVDAQHIRASLGEQFAQTGTQIIEDRDISPGGCMLQAGTSEVDATIETRWKRVLESIGAEPQKWLSP